MQASGKAPHEQGAQEHADSDRRRRHDDGEPDWRVAQRMSQRCKPESNSRASRKWQEEHPPTAATGSSASRKGKFFADW